MGQALPPGEAIPPVPPTPPRHLQPSPPIQPRRRAIPLPPRPIRVLLRGWWALAALFLTTILGALLAVPLANTPSHWWDGVQNQFAALLILGATHPLPSAAVALVVFLITFAAYYENRRVRAEVRRRSREQLSASVAETVSGAVGDRLAPPLRDLAQGQDAALGLGASTLAVASANLVVGSQTLEAIQELQAQLQRGGDHARATLRVFISSTFRDLRDHRALLHQALGRMYQAPVDMVDFGAGGGDPTTVSRAEVAASDVVVLVVAWRYGFIPDDATLSITQMEYDEAMRLGLPVLIYLADDSTESDTSAAALFPADVRDPEHAPQLAAFRALLSDPNRHTFDTFTTPDNLTWKVTTALTRYLLRTSASASGEKGSGSPRVVALAEMPRHGALIGREQELARLLNRLAAGDDVGVFALKGMGGVGKTALAAEAVSRLASDAARFPGGVVWIACTGLTGASGLEAIVERVVGLFGMSAVLAEQDPALRRQRLAEALGYRPPLLLALDNIEPGLDVDALVRTLAVPGHTTLLLTARQRVAPQLLRAIDIAPLPAPNAADLFATRLRQATDDARPTADERAEIAPLVDAVGGLPLAIELLAGFAGEQRIALADLRASLAADGIHAAAFATDPARVITQVFDRSWQALTASQRRLFAALSLLPEAGFPRAAALALAVAASQGTRDDAQDNAHDEARARSAAERDLAALVTQALVSPLEGNRLRLHQLLYHYAADQLKALGRGDAASEQELGAAMVAYWVAYAQAHAGYQWGIAHPNYADVDFLEAEADGLMAAAAYAHDHSLHRAVLAIGHAVNDAWDLRGRRGDSHRLLPWQMSAAQALGDRGEIRWATHEQAVLDAKEGNYPAARTSYEAALRLAQELGDKVAIQAATHELAVLDAREGNHQAARAGYTEALRLAQELGDKAAIRMETHELAVLDAREGNVVAARAGYQAARTGLEEALRLARELGDKAAVEQALRDLATLDAIERRRR